MQLEVNNGIYQRSHFKAVGAVDTALSYIAVLNVESTGGTGVESNFSPLGSA